MNMRISLFKDMLAYGILCLQTGLLFLLSDNLLFFVLQVLAIFVLLMLNKELLVIIIHKITNKIKLR